MISYVPDIKNLFWKLIPVFNYYPNNSTVLSFTSLLPAHIAPSLFQKVYDHCKTLSPIKKTAL